MVDAKVDGSRARGVGERFSGVEACDARSAAADIRFHDHRKSEAFRGFRRESGIVDDFRFGVGQAEVVQDLELQRLGGLHLIRGRPVDYGDTDALEMPQPALGVKGYLAVPAQVSRRARPVEYQ